MARYDYFCPTNQRTVEVSHGMTEDAMARWGDVCRRAGIELGDTPADAPVQRLISGGAMVFTKGKTDGGAEAFGDCSSGMCPCGPGAGSCDWN